MVRSMLLGIVVLVIAVGAYGGSNALLEQTVARALQDEIDEAGLDAARRRLQAATKSDADSGRVRAALGLVEMRLGNGGDARKQARKAVELSPDDAEVHYHRGVICISTVQDALMINMMAIASAAEASYERAIELRPDYLEAHVALAQYHMGRAMFMGGSMEHAERAAETLLTLEGGEVDARIILASVHAQGGRWDEAMAEIDRGIEAAVDDEDAGRVVTTAFTLAFFMLEDMEAVIELAEEKFVERLGSSGDTANWVVGRAYAQKNRHEDAVAQFRRVLEQNPEARTSKFYLAESLERLGEQGEARLWYQRYVDENPKGDLTKQAKKALKRMKR